jgi:dienelactone hydrolase
MTSAEPAHDTKATRLPFTVRRPEEDVPAVLWLPERPAERRPLVLLSHGGTMHKESRSIARLGNWLAGGLGYAALAIDLPYHGDRTPAAERGLSPLERREHVGLNVLRGRNLLATDKAVADWRAAIETAQDLDTASHGPVGYVGLSLGTRFGIPLAAAEPRITAAVFGLFGCAATDTDSAFAQAARHITIPVLYLQQWDDELYPRHDGLALFDLLASQDKSLHGNPGGHFQVPRNEDGDMVQFLRRHLGGEAFANTVQ